jgi:hypothetical protein
MSNADLSLIAWAAASPLVAVTLGFVFQKSRAWAFIDPVYYSLGIIGVLLFFFASHRERDLLAAQQAYLELEREWVQRPNPKPAIAVDARAGESLRGSYEELRWEQRTGESCRGLPSHGCLAYSDHADAIAAATGGGEFEWESSDPEARLRAQERLCAAVADLLERLDGPTLDAGAYAAVKRHLLERRGRNPFLPTRDRLIADIAEAKAQSIQRSPAHQRKWLGERLEIEGRFAIVLSKAAATCALRPGGAQAAFHRMDSWRAEKKSRQVARAEQQAKIASVKGEGAEGQGPLRWLQLRLWPYVLILALALKLGKATAALRSDRAAKPSVRQELAGDGPPSASSGYVGGTTEEDHG